MAKPLIYNVFADVVGKIKSAGFKKVYLKNRPSTVDKAVDSFVVFDLPAKIRRAVIGNDDFMCETEGIIYLYRREKTDGTPNISDQLELASKMMEIFPINTTHMTGTDPSIMLDGSDDNGFQVTVIAFEIRTKVNSYQI